TALDKNFVLNGSGSNNTIEATSGNTPAIHNKIQPSGTVTMNGPCIFNPSASTYLTINAVISGTASLIKSGAGTNILAGAIGYAGTTTVSNGVLLINGSKSSGTGITVTSAGRLGGTGTLN